MKATIIRIWDFYLTGFKSMTIGRTLWFIILLKLFIMFAILKLFFFPNFINTRPEGMTKEEFVSKELIERRDMLKQE
ncbi:DUF4492 domain-containing protein [Bacteroides sp. 214]|uniref:DUF4492 domain-containing protein n=1 Tax=Bacteroides sp. 214 TaxID=2302935 RepID=UPI0013D4A943|nr:DUF4492 domain-containing protein [Bacteroides sp. 214]NDW12970.1 DUF4492 domain-containing protein [Bacteroides sp. 214]